MRIKPPTAQLQSRLLMGAAILTSIGLAPQAFAQKQATTLEEVVVTATKRDEMLQDVPVAVTAVTQAMIETNQIRSVNDLGSLAPNLTVRPAAGGINLPAFNMRGITSYGVVPGSDKEISIYLDGVYIGSPRGAIFTLPDIQQLEVLRGPQGTLFGRNATAGAISVTTRSPSGQFGLRQKVTAGSRDLFATETTIDTPEMGPFSAYLTYTKESQDGDVRNLGAGTVWNRNLFGYGTDTSPKYLGSKDNVGYFVAVQFQPSSDVTVTYKYDRAEDHGSPSATAPIGNLFRPASALTPAVPASTAPNNVQTYLLLDNATAGTFGSFKRPNAVNNSWALNRDQTVQGHSLTATWDINSEWAVKNVLGYRKTDLFSVADVGGGTWTVGPNTFAYLQGTPSTTDNQALGTPYVIGGIQTQTHNWQWSDEIQLDWDTDFATIVTGALFYKSDDLTGGPAGSANTWRNQFMPNYVVPLGNQGLVYNDATSKALFSQAQWHLTDKVDLLTGARYTIDAKSGTFAPSNAGNVPLREQSYNYDAHNTSYLLGVNYKVSNDILVYAKTSTAYVSGGGVSDVFYLPESSRSFELGSKAEFLDGSLRTNIALFDVTYSHIQTTAGGAAIQRSDLSTLNVDGGKLRAKGVELEVTAIPLAGLTLGATLGYQDVNYAFTSATNDAINTAGPLVVNSGLPAPFPATFTIQPAANSTNEPTNAPMWTGNLSANYETEPLFGPAFMSFGMTAAWHDKSRIQPNDRLGDIYGFTYTPESWIVNARAAIKAIDLSNGFTGEVALWGKNLTNDKNITFPGLNTSVNFYVGNFTEERSFGIDFVAKY